MVGHKLVLFAAVIALWTLEILPIKLTRILLMWKYIQEKHYAIFAAVSKAKLFCLASFGMFIKRIELDSAPVFRNAFQRHTLIVQVLVYMRRKFRGCYFSTVTRYIFV